MKIINVTPEMTVLPLGRLGENETTQFVFDVSDWLEEYPGGTIGLAHRLPHTRNDYACTITSEGDGKYSWTITSAELTTEGSGKCELILIKDSKVKKGKVYKTLIGEALDPDEDPPSVWQGYVTDVLHKKEDAEAYAVGKRSGTDVGETDPTYHNNAKYYSEQASGSASAAAGSATTAGGKAQDAEAYAIGKRGGTDVESTDPAYHNNSKYYAENCESLIESATTTATTNATAAVLAAAENVVDGYSKTSEAYAVGKRGGTDVGSSDPAYHNNSKYYSEQAATSATAAHTAQLAAEAAAAEEVSDWLAAHVDPETGYVIDNTLTVTGAAADAKKVGDEIGDLKSANDDQDTQLAMLIDKTVVPPDPPTTATQVCDLTNATRKYFSSSQTYYYQNIKIELPWNGSYYPNPSTINLLFNGLKAYNDQGQQIQLYSNGSTESYVRTFKDGKYIVKTDSRTFSVMTSGGSVDRTYTTNEDIAYLNDSYSYVEVNGDPDQLGGLTYGASSATYVPYGQSSEQEEDVEYEYSYSDDLGDYAFDYISENCTDSEPTENSDNFISSGDIYSALQKQFENSYNLLDESKINWTAVGGYWYLKDGYYFNVTAGKKICSNVFKPTFQFYDTTKTLISTGSAVNPFTLVSIPANTVYCRMFINSASNTQAEIQGKILVYEVDSTMSTNDDRRPYVPPKKIKGNLVEGDIYETALPQKLDTDILNAAQYKAVRALNHQRNAFRIGTFNIYVTRGQRHWELLKKELKDFSIDICGMQEVSNSSSEGRVLQTYLTTNNWQFAYGSQSSFNDTLIDKAIVSAYEIASTNYYTMTTERTYIKTVINLPQYKHISHQFTLSIYNYHGNLTAENRLTEVAEMLTTIASDTSDFIIVIGDTNAFESEADAQGKRPTWEAWKNAGFTPIHYGESPTVTDGSTSIDQIFVGANVSCLYYDVVNSNKYKLTISGNEVAISDHDFLYADLQFDFDAALASLNT